MRTRHPKSPLQFPPDCAEAWGEDEYGLWVKFVFKGVEQIFRWIEPDEFLMGSPEDEPEREFIGKETQHKVTFSKGFWMADSTVTQALWQAVMNDNPSRFKGEQRPVEKVSWNDSQKFIEKLNQSLGGQFSLPGEAQWEYACRAGTQTPFSFGDNITSEQVNYNGQNPYNLGKKGEYREKTVEVKTLPCNDWGLYEMHGNVWEWCQDSWQEELTSEPVIDPGVPSGDDRHVLRGGSWFISGGGVRSAYRDHDSADYRSLNTGLRLSLGR